MKEIEFPSFLFPHLSISDWMLEKAATQQTQQKPAQQTQQKPALYKGPGKWQPTRERKFSDKCSTTAK